MLAQNLAKLLKTEWFEYFRHFLCHELEMEEKKPKLTSLIDPKNWIELEDEFPQILRIGKSHLI